MFLKGRFINLKYISNSMTKPRLKECRDEDISFIKSIIKEYPNFGYDEIIEEGKRRKYPRVIQCCCIAQAKEQMGLLTRIAWNRGKRFKKRILGG